MSVLDRIMSVAEAAEKWGMSQVNVKKLCQNSKVNARKIGRDWVLERDQPNPTVGTGQYARKSEIFRVVLIEQEKEIDTIISVLKFGIEGSARQKAKEWAAEYPQYKVYVEYFRASDGQNAYFNPNGYDFKKQYWTVDDEE